MKLRFIFRTFHTMFTPNFDRRIALLHIGYERGTFTKDTLIFSAVPPAVWQKDWVLYYVKKL